MPAQRLQKVLAAAGVASRRASERLIAEGRVRVDGRVAELGASADPDASRIELDGRPISVVAAHTYIALHKPAGVTSTVRDRHACSTVLDLLAPGLVPPGARVYPVGRLDLDSEGLLLLTNDGGWAERVLHPRFGVERQYAVGLAAPLQREQIRELERGIELDEGTARLAGRLRPITPADLRRVASRIAPPPIGGYAWYGAAIRQGWKRELRRMFAAVGAPVARLVRVRIGDVALGSLPVGGARALSDVEVRSVAPPADPGRASSSPPAAES